MTGTQKEYDDDDKSCHHRDDSIHFQKECFIGGPISCVTVPIPNVCVYGHGPYLHRVRLFTNDDSFLSPPKQSEQSEQQQSLSSSEPTTTKTKRKTTATTNQENATLASTAVQVTKMKSATAITCPGSRNSNNNNSSNRLLLFSQTNLDDNSSNYSSSGCSNSIHGIRYHHYYYYYFQEDDDDYVCDNDHDHGCNDDAAACTTMNQENNNSTINSHSNNNSNTEQKNNKTNNTNFNNNNNNLNILNDSRTYDEGESHSTKINKSNNMVVIHSRNTTTARRRKIERRKRRNILTVVFGGRYLCFVDNVLDDNFVMNGSPSPPPPKTTATTTTTTTTTTTESATTETETETATATATATASTIRKQSRVKDVGVQASVDTTLSPPSTTTRCTIPMEVLPIKKRQRQKNHHQQQQQQQVEQEIEQQNQSRTLITAKTIERETTSTSLQLSDWIWDCQCIRSLSSSGSSSTSYSVPCSGNDPNTIKTPISSAGNSTTCSLGNNIEETEIITNFTLLVGLAHNTVDVWIIEIASTSATPTTSLASSSISSDLIESNKSKANSFRHSKIRINNAIRISSVQGESRCITYCANLFTYSNNTNVSSSEDDDSDDESMIPATARATYVAFGTVTNEILVWKVPVTTTIAQANKRTTTASTVENSQCTGDVIVPNASRLRGHKGVIHAVEFCITCTRTTGSDSGKSNSSKLSNNRLLLASTSDDRSVRVWEQRQFRDCTTASNGAVVDTSAEEDVWVLLWTGWGHTARGWDVHFATVRIQITKVTATSTSESSCSSSSSLAPHSYDSVSSTSRYDTVNTMLNKKNTMAVSEKTSSIQVTKSVLLSTGEDGTMRVWDYGQNFCNPYCTTTSITSSSTSCRNNRREAMYSNFNSGSYIASSESSIAMNKEMFLSACSTPFTKTEDSETTALHQTGITDTNTSASSLLETDMTSSSSTISNSLLSSLPLPLTLCSTSSDLLCVLRGHSCQCIWKTDSNEYNNLAVTAGNDGTIALYNLADRIMINLNTLNNTLNKIRRSSSSSNNSNKNNNNDNVPHPLTQEEEVQQRTSKEDIIDYGTSWERSFLLPNDEDTRLLEPYMILNGTPCDISADIAHNPCLVANDFYSENSRTEDGGEADATADIIQKKKRTKKNECNSSNSDAFKKNTDRKYIKQQHQTVVGMKFFHSDSCNAELCLLIATRTGSLRYLAVQSRTWIDCNSWCFPSDRTAIDVSSAQWSPPTSPLCIDPIEGCCMTIHPNLLIVTIGTTKGDIVLAPLGRITSSTTPNSSQQISYDHYQRLSARDQRAVQKVEWLSDNVLLTFHARSCVWWSFEWGKKYSTESELEQGHPLLPVYARPLVLQIDSNGMGISSAYNEVQKCLCIGDTRGNIFLFSLKDVGNNVDGKTSSMLPTSILHRAHQKEHVTSLVWKDRSRIISVGNDGCMLESIIRLDGTLEKLISVPVGAFTGLNYVWIIPVIVDNNATDTIRYVVGGYYGNRFAMIDVLSGYEFCTVQTGGRQRLIDVCMNPNEFKQDFPLSSCFAICINMKGGSNEILLHMNTSNKNQLSRHLQPSLWSIGRPVHGETIFDLCFFPVDISFERIALLSGSEDCTAKLFLYQNGALISTTALPPQVSGIRAVCSSCRYDDYHSTLIVIAGKLTVECYLVDVTTKASITNLDVRYVGCGRTPEKHLIDHRINALRAVPVYNNKEETIHLVVTGDSNGSCYVYFVSESIAHKKSMEGQLLYKHERPILSLDVICCNSRFILFVGTTGGDIMALELPTNTESFSQCDNGTSTPILEYQAHSMGTNSISAKVITQSKNVRNSLHDFGIRIVSGGDDQKVCCVDVLAKFQDAEGTAARINIVRQVCRENAALSAIKGVKLISQNEAISTGYDQRLTLMRCDARVLSKQSHVAITVGDVNCLAHFEHDSGKHLIAIGGAGIEILSLG